MDKCTSIDYCLKSVLKEGSLKKIFLKRNFAGYEPAVVTGGFISGKNTMNAANGAAKSGEKLSDFASFFVIFNFYGGIPHYSSSI